MRQATPTLLSRRAKTADANRLLLVRFRVVSADHEEGSLAARLPQWLRPPAPQFSLRRPALPAPSANIHSNDLRDEHLLPIGSKREDEVLLPEMRCLLSYRCQCHFEDERRLESSPTVARWRSHQNQQGAWRVA